MELPRPSTPTQRNIRRTLTANRALSERFQDAVDIEVTLGIPGIRNVDAAPLKLAQPQPPCSE